MRRYHPPIEPDHLQWFSSSNAVAAGFGLLTGVAMITGLLWAGARGDSQLIEAPQSSEVAATTSSAPPPVPTTVGVEDAEAASAGAELREQLIERSLGRRVRYGPPQEPQPPDLEPGWDYLP